MKNRYILIMFIVIIILTSCTGCWDYREVEDLGLVAGAALDMDANGKFILTVQVVKTMTGSNSKQALFYSRVYTSIGETVFDAVRNMIELTKKKIYWGHTKVFILGESLVQKSIIPVLDWVLRDAEPRPTMDILVCKNGKASDIISLSESYQGILSYDLADALKIQHYLSKAPRIEVWKIAKKFNEFTKCAVLPVIQLVTDNQKQVTQIGGSAIFRTGVFSGYLSDEETKYYLFASDLIKGGLLTVDVKTENQTEKVSLEIKENNTTIKTSVKDKTRPVIEIKTLTKVNINEVDGSTDVTTPEELDELTGKAAKDLEMKITEVCNKVLHEYRSDIFDFAKYIQIQNTSTWREYEKGNSWSESIVKNTVVTVRSEVDVKITGNIENEIIGR